MTTTKKETTPNQQKPGPRANKADGESAVLEVLAAMPEPDRTLGERLHAIIKASAPALSPKLWYGMPAYAKDGKVVCFFQSAQKFNTRYATLGFMHEANLDEGTLWPTAFALKELTAAEEATIAGLVKKAVSGGPSSPLIQDEAQASGNFIIGMLDSLLSAMRGSYKAF